MRNVYMLNGQTGRARRQGNLEKIRVFSPYIIIGALALFLLWHERSSSTTNTNLSEGGTADGVSDWTHKLSLRNDDVNDGRPDDDNTRGCPTPSGNWKHTCLQNLTIEGPCNGRCMLKASCEDLDQVIRPTTFEYLERATVDIKNVNGLLCHIDGSTSCGVNFHGNLASLHCSGRTPRRHEKSLDGKLTPYTPPTSWPSVDRSEKSKADADIWKDDDQDDVYRKTNVRPRQLNRLANDDLEDEDVLPKSRSGRRSMKVQNKEESFAGNAKPADWTHRLSSRRPAELDDQGPDDRNERSCPTPRGNWPSTCLKNITVEGPCNERCILLANCEDLNQNMVEATFEFQEEKKVEIKNVNGLLCLLDDAGSPFCGLNFHGNRASLSCQGYIPRRREHLAKGKDLPSGKSSLRGLADDDEFEDEPPRHSRRSPSTRYRADTDDGGDDVRDDDDYGDRKGGGIRGRNRRSSF